MTDTRPSPTLPDWLIAATETARRRQGPPPPRAGVVQVGDVRLTLDAYPHGAQPELPPLRFAVLVVAEVPAACWHPTGERYVEACVCSDLPESGGDTDLMCDIGPACMVVRCRTRVIVNVRRLAERIGTSRALAADADRLSWSGESALEAGLVPAGLRIWLPRDPRAAWARADAERAMLIQDSWELLDAAEEATPSQECPCASCETWRMSDGQCI